MAFTISGTNGINLGTQPLTGVLPDANAPSGSVIQVVNSTYSTQTATTSTSFVTTGLSASITPSSSSSKILIVASYTALDTTTYQQSWHTIYRGSTNLGHSSYGMLQWYGNVNNPYSFQVALSYLDSPSTTSSTTYSTYMRSGSGQSIRAFESGTVGSIILMEIAA
jgi:hypothetical protein